jgi:hypothetical protein
MRLCVANAAPARSPVARPRRSVGASTSRNNMRRKPTNSGTTNDSDHTKSVWKSTAGDRATRATTAALVHGPIDVSRCATSTRSAAAMPPSNALSASAERNTRIGSSVNQCTGASTVAYPGRQVLWLYMFHRVPPPTKRAIANCAGSSGQMANSRRPREVNSRSAMTVASETAHAARHRARSAPPSPGSATPVIFRRSIAASRRVRWRIVW